MNDTEFKTAYHESRNGANGMYRHLFGRFVYSDGVRDCADAGCHWLLDILATELTPALFRSHHSTMCIVTVTVADTKATIVGSFFDDDPKPYQRDVPYTDMPDGEWVLYMSCLPCEGGGDQRVCILPTEY